MTTFPGKQDTRPNAAPKKLRKRPSNQTEIPGAGRADFAHFDTSKLSTPSASPKALKTPKGKRYSEGS